MNGDVKDWYFDHKLTTIGNPLKENENKSCDFCVYFQDENKEGYWKVSFHHLICFEEEFSFDGYKLQVKSDYCDSNITFEDLDNDRRVFGYYTLSKNNEKILNNERIRFRYQGSILSTLQEPEVDKIFGGVVKYVRDTRTFDLLNPSSLRLPSISSDGSIGKTGEFLASYFDMIGEEKRNDILMKLRKCFPQLNDVKVTLIDYTEKKILSFIEDFSEKLEFVSYHANDGLLRMIAILTQMQSNNPFLLFDEIENGINTEIIEFLMDELVGSDKQIVVTTHSPMILNFIDDDIARKGVHYFYKTNDGFTHSFPFFAVPRINKKLEVLGPGEAFVDTDLIKLGDEILELKNKEKKVCI
jgi:hypothetical protein